MEWFKKKKGKEIEVGSIENLQTGKALLVSDYLALDRIHLFGRAITKDGIFEELVKSLPYPKKQMALNAILEREKSGSTVIGTGIAAPHARLVDVPDIIAALGICPTGVSDSSDGGLIQFFIFFLGPANNMKRNLDFLASVSALFLTEGLSNSLLELATPEAVLAKIREVEKR